MANKQSNKNIIQEMIGRITNTQQTIWKNIKVRFENESSIEAISYERSDYALTRAIYLASVVKDESGKEKGKEYILGATFGKRIVNAVTSFAFAQLPTVTFKSTKQNPVQEKDLDELNEFINDWLNKNKKDVFNTIKFCIRDGDGFVKVKDDLKLSRILPSRVKLIADPLNDGALKGIIISAKVTEGDTDYIYETHYTKAFPYEITYKYEDGDEDNKAIYNINSGDEKVDSVSSLNDLNDIEVDKDIEKPLPIVNFHNERESGYLYGTSDYQNVYYIMANYHGVLSNAIDNNIFNSQSQPYITGVENINEWLQTNGELNKDTGEYELDWDSKDAWVGSKGFEIKMLQGAQNASEAVAILSILFYLICQGSETPEFIMGTAVQSSKASVSEQLPVIIQKAEMKRIDFNEYYRNLIYTVIYKAVKSGQLLLSTSVIDNIDNIDFDIDFPSMVSDDKKLNLEIIKTLSDEGVISDRTKLLLANLDVVDDIDSEVEQAQKEAKDKNEAYGNFSLTDQQRIQDEIESLN